MSSKAKKIKLTLEEEAVEASLERGEWKARPTSEVRRYRRVAKESLEHRRKEARVNIRMAGVDVALLKKRALEEGVGYQTLMSAIIHKYVTDQLVERKYVDLLAAKIAKTIRKRDEAA